MKRTRDIGFILAGLAIALFLAMAVSNFANPNPDGLERAAMNVSCSDAPDQEACLEELAGEAVYAGPPGGLSDYEVTWLSGLVGVLASFLVAAGLAYLVRSGGARGGRASSLR